MSETFQRISALPVILALSVIPALSVLSALPAINETCMNRFRLQRNTHVCYNYKQQFCRKGNTDMADQNKKSTIKNKEVIVDLFCLWLALTALSCAAINLHLTLNKLEQKKEE